MLSGSGAQLVMIKLGNQTKTWPFKWVHLATTHQSIKLVISTNSITNSTMHQPLSMEILFVSKRLDTTTLCRLETITFQTVHKRATFNLCKTPHAFLATVKSRK